VCIRLHLGAARSAIHARALHDVFAASSPYRRHDKTPRTPRFGSNRRHAARDKTLVTRNPPGELDVASSGCKFHEGWEASMTLIASCGTTLRRLRAAVRGSPITVRFVGRILYTRDWASMRKSPHVDAFVLAWIASHVRAPRNVRRGFM
jgi:hypothetical protein